MTLRFSDFLQSRTRGVLREQGTRHGGDARRPLQALSQVSFASLDRLVNEVVHITEWVFPSKCGQMHGHWQGTSSRELGQLRGGGNFSSQSSATRETCYKRYIVAVFIIFRC